MTKLSRKALVFTAVFACLGAIIPMLLHGAAFEIMALLWIPFGVVLAMGVGALLGSRLFPVK
ncbi:MAG: hypothetical protein ACYS47_02840 [Planctomycetota bacterium]|jgi:hypothetical protein